MFTISLKNRNEMLFSPVQTTTVTTATAKQSQIDKLLKFHRNPPAPI